MRWVSGFGYNPRMNGTRRFRILLAITCLAASACPAGEAEWPRFRGTDGNGAVADDPRLPDRWSETENVLWVVDVPGLGWSSPVVADGKVFVTSVVNDKAAENEQPKPGLYLGEGRRGVPSGTHQWTVLAFDLGTGKPHWKEVVRSGTPPVGRHPKSTYAAETPATDGEQLYVLFGDVGLFCFDLDGNRRWTHPIEAKATLADYGAAASPVVHGDRVFYVYDNQEASEIVALDAASGQVAWRVPRDEPSTWATPLVWRTDDRVEIVVPGKKRIRSYGLDGTLIWEMDGRMSNLVIPSPLAAEGLLYIASGYVGDMNRPAWAIRPGAVGDITLAEGETSNKFVQWFQPKGGPYNPSPLVYRGIYYLLLDRGMMSAYDARTGELLYDRVRFPRGASFTASPWACNGRVFCLDERGTTHVLAAGREFRPLHANELDAETCLATPAVADGRLLLRTAGRLLCIGTE